MLIITRFTDGEEECIRQTSLLFKTTDQIITDLIIVINEQNIKLFL